MSEVGRRVGWLLVASAVWLQPGTKLDPRIVTRDLTGDGTPETLRLAGSDRTSEALDITFTIESRGKTLYRFTLMPLTRAAGADAGRRPPAVRPQARLDAFARWFFDREKFQRPAEFVDSLRGMAPARAAEIAEAIARDRPPSETRSGNEIWEEIRRSPVTIFTFSPGGDTIVAIGWSARGGRFYRLLECC